MDINATTIAQTWNLVVLCALVLAPLIVAIDAKRRGFSAVRIVCWSLISLVVFPIGFGVYFLLGRRKTRR